MKDLPAEGSIAKNKSVDGSTDRIPYEKIEHDQFYRINLRIKARSSHEAGTTQVNQNGSVYGRVSGRSNAGRTVIKVGSNTAV